MALLVGRTFRSAAALALGALAAACMRSLPEQDLRILSATPAAKISADILWKEYLDDARAADGRYWGKAILVTGVATTVSKDGLAPHVIVFGQTQKAGVRAQLLDDQASTILAGVSPGDRVALKCFCAGFKDDVLLKSCVRTD